MALKKKRTFIYCCVLIVLTFLISLRPMILSTYASVDSSILLYLCTFFPLVVLFVFTSRYSEHALPPLCCTLASVLTFGNASAMPLLRYTSAYEVDNVLAYSKSLCMNSSITVVLVPVVWFFIWLCSWISAESKNHKWLCGGYAGVSVILVFAILFLTDKDSGTTIIHFPGVSLQAALPVMIFSILGIPLSWHIQKQIMRIAILSGVAVINAALFIMGESGIPLITLLAFCLWYYLLQPARYRLISVSLPIVLGCGIVSILAIHTLAPVLPSTGLLHILSDKIERRIFSDSVEQVERAIRSIRTGGFWGSSGYNINVPEASSDFCLSTIIHYSGLVFLLLILSAAIPTFYSGVKYYTNQKHDLCSDFGSMSLSAMFIMIYYNILMCSGHLPVLGSQLPFTGVSVTYAILSAFLLAAITYSRKMISNVSEKLKGGLAYAQS